MTVMNKLARPSLSLDSWRELMLRIMLRVQSDVQPHVTWTEHNGAITLRYWVGTRKQLRLIARPETDGLYLNLYEGWGDPSIGEGIVHAWGAFRSIFDSEPTIVGSPLGKGVGHSWQDFRILPEIGGQLAISAHSGRPELCADISRVVQFHLKRLAA